MLLSKKKTHLIQYEDMKKIRRSFPGLSLLSSSPYICPHIARPNKIVNIIGYTKEVLSSPFLYCSYQGRFESVASVANNVSSGVVDPTTVADPVAPVVSTSAELCVVSVLNSSVIEKDVGGKG